MHLSRLDEVHGCELEMWSMTREACEVLGKAGDPEAVRRDVITRLQRMYEAILTQEDVTVFFRKVLAHRVIAVLRSYGLLIRPARPVARMLAALAEGVVERLPPRNVQDAAYDAAIVLEYLKRCRPEALAALAPVYPDFGAPCIDPELTQRQYRLADEVRAYLEAELGVKLLPHGSRVTALYLQDSDFDYTIDLEAVSSASDKSDEEEDMMDDGARKKRMLRRAICAAATRAEMFEARAWRVGDDLVRLRVRNGELEIAVDVSMGSWARVAAVTAAVEAMRSAEFSALVRRVKAWARARGIHGAAAGFWSSYGYMLSVGAFLRRNGGGRRASLFEYVRFMLLEVNWGWEVVLGDGRTAAAGEAAGARFAVGVTTGEGRVLAVRERRAELEFVRALVSLARGASLLDDAALLAALCAQ